jgi:arsenate reductase (thioredoxin)
MNNAKPTLLFVCVHNAGRSQLAAGLAALRGGDQVTVLSAGLDPDDKVSDVALASLAEAGIDRSDQIPTKLTDDLVTRADVVVALKPGLDLPRHEDVRYETWPLPDPANWDVDGIRPLRDYIDAKVQELLAELPPPAGVPSGH